MLKEIGLLEKEDEGLLDSCVHRHPQSTFCHQWAYRQVVSHTFGHRSHYLAAWQDGEIRGILPLFAVKSWLFGRFLVSLPFVDYGGICADDEETERALWQEAVRLARQESVQSIELRQRYPRSLSLPVQTHKVNLVLPLSANAEMVWQGLKGKVCNQVRKAKKSGLTFEAGGPEMLADFYRVWSHNMRDLGTPAYPRAFFENFLHAFPDSSEVLLVRHGQKPVGTGIAVYFKVTMEVPWASSLREYFPKCPNNLLYWGAIRRACEQGCQEFHFGRSTMGSGNYRFKKQWGAQDQRLYYQYWLAEGTEMPDLNPHSPRYRLAVALWRRLPIAVANALGPWIVRGIP